MAGFLEHEDLVDERGIAAREKERGRGSGRTAADDDHRTSFHGRER